MNNDLKNILSDNNKDIDNQQLLNYLSNKLQKEELHDVEKNIADNDFLNDAVEGLQSIGSSKNIQDYVEQLNKELHKKTAKNKRRKDKRKWKDQPWIYIAVLIVLLFVIICFLVLKHSK